MIKSAPSSLDFSKQQINNLVHRNKMSETLYDFTKSANVVNNPLAAKRSLEFSGRVEVNRVASQRDRQYFLVKNDEVDQQSGWKMKINESLNMPIKIEKKIKEDKHVKDERMEVDIAQAIQNSLNEHNANDYIPKESVNDSVAIEFSDEDIELKKAIAMSLESKNSIEISSDEEFEEVIMNTTYNTAPKLPESKPSLDTEKKALFNISESKRVDSAPLFTEDFYNSEHEVVISDSEHKNENEFESVKDSVCLIDENGMPLSDEYHSLSNQRNITLQSSEDEAILVESISHSNKICDVKKELEISDDVEEVPVESFVGTHYDLSKYFSKDYADDLIKEFPIKVSNFATYFDIKQTSSFKKSILFYPTHLEKKTPIASEIQKDILNTININSSKITLLEEVEDSKSIPEPITIRDPLTTNYQAINEPAYEQISDEELEIFELQDKEIIHFSSSHSGEEDSLSEILGDDAVIQSINELSDIEKDNYEDFFAQISAENSSTIREQLIGERDKLNETRRIETRNASSVTSEMTVEIQVLASFLD